MSNMMSSVNQRTNLVGNNRLELLLFRLHGKQLFGINVFKVREVLQCPELTEMPGASKHVRGIAHLRGVPVMVIDLNQAVGGKRIEDLSTAFILVTEYNRHTQGFLVNGVERIVNMKWDQILPPPQGAGTSHYLTAVTEIDKNLVQIIDVEKVFAEISPADEVVSDKVKSHSADRDFANITVLVVDDSAVARNQVKRALTSAGITVELVNDGKSALTWLQNKAEQLDCNIADVVPIVISDIEMPEMDGYTLTAEIKADPDLKLIHVVLHSSLSGIFNQAMVKKVGADDFIAKFHPDELVSAVQKWLMNE
ncbi:chemotaxis protein CheV [Rheinheimera sp. MMS21-TC3]|uniref:chemotaxis protein CheV n=1 Tax=Rheinheimera sp. MMS21-TC3 TaxID=3072790 RepID=UPI0028C50233|nr:chemotaxis protein CheV [Rheinheimera sp. MMS21-TC3]WNO61433.1 chemotaxis protein CheV [Rheinheimera sp. MMS21-TC3]